jgi:hypothetical protein
MFRLLFDFESADADPDPYQNIMDTQHWYLLNFFYYGTFRFRKYRTLKLL